MTMRPAPIAIRTFARCSMGALLVVVAAASVRVVSAAADDPPAPTPGAASNAPPVVEPAAEPPADARGGRRGMRVLPPDWPRAGGFGPDSERPMIEGLVVQGLVGGQGDGARRALTDEDVAKAVAVAKEIAPDWGAALEARTNEDPARMRNAFGGSARRLLALVALKERAPKVYEARVAELKAQAATARAAGDLRAAEADESVAADAKAVRLAQLSQALDEAVSRQVEATLAARREELVALEARLAALKQDLASDGQNRAAIAADVKARAKELREAPEAPPAAGRPDGPRRGE